MTTVSSDDLFLPPVVATVDVDEETVSGTHTTLSRIQANTLCSDFAGIIANSELLQDSYGEFDTEREALEFISSWAAYFLM